MHHNSQDLSQIWQETHVANLMAIANPETGTETGAFSITDNLPLIFSLDPARDFEVSNRDVDGWKLVFTTSNGEMLGMTGYFKALSKLKPYILDEQNGSILIRALSREELEELYYKAC